MAPDTTPSDGGRYIDHLLNSICSHSDGLDYVRHYPNSTGKAQMLNEFCKMYSAFRCESPTKAGSLTDEFRVYVRDIVDFLAEELGGKHRATAFLANTTYIHPDGGTDNRVCEGIVMAAVDMFLAENGMQRSGTGLKRRSRSWAGRATESRDSAISSRK